MMRHAMLLSIVIGVLACPLGIVAQSPVAPRRPLPVTSTQFHALRQLESQPEHTAVLTVHATYKSERERHLEFSQASDDFLTVVTQVGYPAAVAAILIISGM